MKRPSRKFVLFHFMDTWVYKLILYTETLSDQEQESFLFENSEAAFCVTMDVFGHQVEKMKVKEKSSKNNVTINGKEVATISRIVCYLKKLVQSVPEKVRSGWNKKTFVTAMYILLDSRNHQYIRAEGFSLLLLWLNSFLERNSFHRMLNISSEELDTHAEGAIRLYLNAISLAKFEPFSVPLPVKVAYSPIICDLDKTDPPNNEPWEGKGKVYARQSNIVGGFSIDSTGSKATGKTVSIISFIS